MESWKQIIFILLSLLAEILGTIGGFGSSVLFVPIAGLFFDFQSVLGITALFHLSSNISKITLFRKGLNKKLLLYLGLPGVLTVVAGGLLTRYIDEHILSLILGIFICTISILLLVFRNFSISPTRLNAVLGGSLSGFMAGLVGTGGTIRGVTLIAFNLEKEVFIATSAAIDFLIDLSRSVVYFLNGYIHSHDLVYIPVLFVVGFVGTWIGKKVLNRISNEGFRKIVLIFLLVVGIFTLAELIFPGIRTAISG